MDTNHLTKAYFEKEVKGWDVETIQSQRGLTRHDPWGFDSMMRRSHPSTWPRMPMPEYFPRGSLTFVQNCRNGKDFEKHKEAFLANAEHLVGTAPLCDCFLVEWRQRRKKKGRGYFFEVRLHRSNHAPLSIGSKLISSPWITTTVK